MDPPRLGGTLGQELAMHDLLQIIRDRHSSRMPFDEERPLSKEDLSSLLEAARWAPTAHNMQNFEIIVVDDGPTLNAMGAIEYEVSEAFVRENFLQLSFSEAELHSKKVGLLGTMFPESWRVAPAEQAPSNPNLHSTVARSLETSAAVLVVVYDPRRRAPASEGDFLGIMSLGCVLENMWLVAQSLGIGFHVVSILGDPTVERDVKRTLGIPDPLRVAFGACLGYPVSAQSNRVRRTLHDFVHHNRYGCHGV